MNVHRYRTRTIRAVAWVGAAIALFGLIALASDRHANFTCDPEPHSVQYGDTLWAIAEAKCEGNIQYVTDNLVDVYGTNIQLGQSIWLPTSDECLLEQRGGEVYDECG